MPRLLRALRGAVTVPDDNPDEAASEVEALLRESLTRNDIALEDLVSIFFTATDDIQSVFPAQVARERFGLSDVPMMCAKELSIDGALPRVIRILVHFYTDRARDEVEHVYLGAATSLRPDLAV